MALKRLKMEKEKEGFPITSLREINTILKAQHPNIVTVRVRRSQPNAPLPREGCAIHTPLRLASSFTNSVKVNTRLQKCQALHSCLTYRSLLSPRVCALGFQVSWESQWSQGWGLGVPSANRPAVVS